jgi:hypothetical protein
MSSFAIDSDRHVMLATGIVSPVMEWATDAEGRRRPSEVQAVDRDDEGNGSGLPLWGVEAVYTSSSWGRVSTATALVSVPAREKPRVEAFKPVSFDGLVVDVSVNRAKGLTERWSAAGLKATAKATSGQAAA